MLFLADAVFLRPCERNKVQRWKMSFRWFHSPSLPVPEAELSTNKLSLVTGAHKQHPRSCTCTETHTQPLQALQEGDCSIFNASQQAHVKRFGNTTWILRCTDTSVSTPNEKVPLKHSNKTPAACVTFVLPLDKHMLPWKSSLAV